MTKTNEARIETCTFCNYTCKFCPHKDGFTRKQEIMTYSLFEEILNKIKKEAPHITDITLSGFGEALLDKKISQKFYLSHSMGYNNHLVTNGSLLNKTLIDNLLSSNVDIRISLHTVHEDEYKQTTGSDKLLHVMKMIEYIISHPQKTKIILTADIVEENKENIQDLINLYKNRVDLIEVWKPHGWIDWKEYRHSINKKTTCNRPMNGPLQIQVDGTVNMCCFDFNGKLLLGDYKTQSLDEIFSSQEYKDILQHHTSGTIDNSNLLCRHCDQLLECNDIVIYNSKFKAEDRINKLSTTYKELI